jgi:pimeloyl-ACP methyl ester carboxylesterase
MGNVCSYMFGYVASGPHSASQLVDDILHPNWHIYVNTFYPDGHPIDSQDDGNHRAGRPVAPLTGRPVVPLENDVPVILYSYGNLDKLDTIGPTLQMLSIKLGCVIVGYDYPGYGRSKGYANEHTVYETVMWVYQQHVVLVFPDNPHYLWGKSIGSVATTYLATKVGDRLSGVILESAFCTALSTRHKLTRARNDPDRVEPEPGTNHPRLDEFIRFVEHHLDFMRNIERVEDPSWKPRMLIVYGECDVLIPGAHAQRLYDKSPLPPSKKKLVPIPGGKHNLEVKDIVGPVRKWLHSIN